MSQLLKKFALLTACAALALCFTTRPAQAQMVDPGGTGEHLLFAYWSTANYTNTNVNIHSPLGVQEGLFVDKTTVYVRIRGTAPDRNTVASFNICLMPGDSWTATLSMEDGLMVMDPGECDGDLRPLASNPGNMNMATPKEGEMVSLGAADSGYIEAWLNPRNSLEDDTLLTENPDADFSPEDSAMQYISGTAMLVSPMSGFSSSYNAVALMGCDIKLPDLVADDTATPSTLGVQLSRGAGGTATSTGTTAADDDMDGDGCWTTVTASPALIDSPAMNGVLYALQGQTTPTVAVAVPAVAGQDTMNDRDILTGRWTAIADDNVMSHTKVILTFPTNHLNYPNGSSDPVSVYVFDDMGDMALSSAGLSLAMGVNMCMFMEDMLSCNGTDVGSLGGATSGEFRIFNNTAEGVSARVKEVPGLSMQRPAESLGALGLIFSYFEGSDGKEYDQITPVQWIDVDRDMNEATPDDPPDPSNDDSTAGYFDTGIDM